VAAPCITAPFMLPSAHPTASAPAITHFRGSIAHPHSIAVYASPAVSPLPMQYSLPGGQYPYLGRTCTGWIAPASPGAPEVGSRASSVRETYAPGMVRMAAALQYQRTVVVLPHVIIVFVGSECC
jgi:hypothetical protein